MTSPAAARSSLEPRDDFLQALARSLADGSFVKLVFSDARDAKSGPRRLTVRPVTLKSGIRWQWASQLERQETHENRDQAQTLAAARAASDGAFRRGHLLTTTGDYELRLAGKNATLRQQPASRGAAQTAHDRKKPYLIPEGRPCEFLEAVGVMTPDGRVKAKSQAKFRQINRYLEFVEDIYPHLPAEGTIHVADFGCGKSYLTFALHDLLTRIHQRDVKIVGLDRNESVISTCRNVARDLRLEGIEFRVGDLASLADDEPIHLAVSLHACDTATDHALAAAVHRHADVILAVPCCQHEIANVIREPTLLLRHGILKERFAALVTDTLRATLMELAGYRTQVIEFIDMEHTPKNILLRCVRRDGGLPGRDALLAEYRAFKAMTGIEEWTLERLLAARLD